jgi:hypothetical protein
MGKKLQKKLDSGFGSDEGVEQELIRNLELRIRNEEC